MDTPEVKIRRRPKKEAAPAAEAAATEAPEAQAETPAVVPPPPPAAAPVKPKATGPDLTLPLAHVQFHTGVNLGPGLTTTGVNVVHLKNTRNIDIEMRLIGPGVWLSVKTAAYTKSFGVPFSNILHWEFAAK